MVESQGALVDSICIAFGVLSVVTLSLRIWARWFVVQHFGIDDYLICVAALFSWAFIGATIASVRYGLGSHIGWVEQHLGPDALLKYGEIVWFSSIFYNACLGFIKTSVLSLYMRLGDRRLRRLAVAMIVVVFCQAGGAVGACIFQCSPVKAAWQKTGTYKCIDISAFYLANAAVNIFTDIMTYSLPIPLATRLQMPLQQRIGLAVILSLGLLACVSSIIRISYIPQMLTSTDATWAITGAMYWSVIEINVGILAASIPSWKVLAKKYVPRLLGSSNNDSSKRTKSVSGFPLSPIGKRRSAHASKTAHLGTGTVRGGRVKGSDSSDEEALFTPSGSIGVKTEIQMRFDAK